MDRAVIAGAQHRNPNPRKRFGQAVLGLSARPPPHRHPPAGCPRNLVSRQGLARPLRARLPRRSACTDRLGRPFCWGPATARPFRRWTPWVSRLPPEVFGAPGQTRTGTSLRTTDFESAASTDSATGATPDAPDGMAGSYSDPTRGQWSFQGPPTVPAIRAKRGGAGWRPGVYTGQRQPPRTQRPHDPPPSCPATETVGADVRSQRRGSA